MKRYGVEISLLYILADEHYPEQHLREEKHKQSYTECKSCQRNELIQQVGAKATASDRYLCLIHSPSYRPGVRGEVDVDVEVGYSLLLPAARLGAYAIVMLK